MNSPTNQNGTIGFDPWPYPEPMNHLDSDPAGSQRALGSVECSVGRQAQHLNPMPRHGFSCALPPFLGKTNTVSLWLPQRNPRNTGTLGGSSLCQLHAPLTNCQTLPRLKQFSFFDSSNFGTALPRKVCPPPNYFRFARLVSCEIGRSTANRDP